MKVFDTIKLTKPKKSVFDLSHEKILSMNMGNLVPIMCEEVIPGDKFRLNMESLVRLQPMLAPMMHRVNVFTHFFFVPYRIIWNEWEKFITGGDKGTDTPVFPTFASSTPIDSQFAHLRPGSLADYLGIPVANFPQTGNITIANQQGFSQLPFRAYHTIYNEYYRDQNLRDPIPVDKGSGVKQIKLGNDNDWESQWKFIRLRAWEKDYFTSALPFAQKGSQLSLPLMAEANLVTENNNSVTVSNATTPAGGSNKYISTLGSGNLKAVLNESSTTSINDLRKAFQVQKWLEKNARSGSRYVETLLAHFGVKSSDARLQRPEYLGGGKTPIVVSEVLQTSATETDSAQGNMAGHGISVGSTHTFKKYFEEHGLVMGIMSILPRTSYFQGMPRMFQKTDKFDYFWPEFAHLGEQPVFNNEVYYTPNNSTTGKNAFGYQPRYTEYRYIPNRVHGDLVSNLEYWHMARKFDSAPALNASFIQANPTNRIFAVTDSDSHKVIVNCYFNLQAIRPIPKHGNPGGI